MLFKNKNKKVVNVDKRKGCLRRLIIGVVIIVVLGIISVIAAMKTLTVFGVGLNTFNDYVSWLNEPVDENSIAKNPIREGDFTTFKAKAEASGFTAFDINGNVNLNIPTIALNSNLTIADYELGAMINNLSQKENGEKFFSLLELSITEISDNLYTLTTVIKFDLTDIKNALGKNAVKVPGEIYLTCSGVAYTAGSRVQTKENTVQINQLSKDKNDTLIGFLNKVAEDTKNNEFLKIIDINNYIVTEILTDLTQRSNSLPVLGNGPFSLILK